MNEDPVFSGGMVKALLVILVAGAPRGRRLRARRAASTFPTSTSTSSDQTTTNLTDTELSDTTIGDEPAEPDPADADRRPVHDAPPSPRRSAVREAEAGSGRQLTRLFINPVQTQFIVVDGDGIEAFSVRADDPSEVVQEEATITISGATPRSRTSRSRSTPSTRRDRPDARERAEAERRGGLRADRPLAGAADPVRRPRARVDDQRRGRAGGTCSTGPSPTGQRSATAAGGGTPIPPPEAPGSQVPDSLERGPEARRVHREGGPGHREDLRLPRRGQLSER